MAITKIFVTKKEYQEVVNKYWKEEITAQELSKYEIVLSKLPESKNEFINKLIIAHCTDQREGTEKNLYMGNVSYLNGSELNANGFTYISEWSDSYREVYTSEKDNVILTTCEGDLSINLMDNEEAYKKEYTRQEEFYNKYA